MMQGALILLPLGDVPPAWAARILRFSISSAVKFFPMRLIMEDEAALQRAPGKYIVGEGQLRNETRRVCFRCAIAEGMQRACSDLLRFLIVCLTTGSRLSSAAFEPHSALPLAMPGVFCEYSGLLPPALKGIRVLASSSVGAVPVSEGLMSQNMAHALQHTM